MSERKIFLDFNSIKVRLKLVVGIGIAIFRPDFNSIKVRLKPKINPRCYSSLTFQFHKGTIKTSIRLVAILAVHHFNSIKVRLKLASSGFLHPACAFQFHKGTIKTSPTAARRSGFLISIP